MRCNLRELGAPIFANDEDRLGCWWGVHKTVGLPEIEWVDSRAAPVVPRLLAGEFVPGSGDARGLAQPWSRALPVIDGLTGEILGRCPDSSGHLSRRPSLDEYD